MYIVNRTQIYLNEHQHDALARLAHAQNTTSSALIRDAIDAYLASQLTPADRLDRLRSLGRRLTAAASPSDTAERVDALRTKDLVRLDSRP